MTVTITKLRNIEKRLNKEGKWNRGKWKNWIPFIQGSDFRTLLRAVIELKKPGKAA